MLAPGNLTCHSGRHECLLGQRIWKTHSAAISVRPIFRMACMASRSSQPCLHACACGFLEVLCNPPRTGEIPLCGSLFAVRAVLPSFPSDMAGAALLGSILQRRLGGIVSLSPRLQVAADLHLVSLAPETHLETLGGLKGG